jgi:hypothetical protein
VLRAGVRKVARYLAGKSATTQSLSGKTHEEAQKILQLIRNLHETPLMENRFSIKVSYFHTRNGKLPFKVICASYTLRVAVVSLHWLVFYMYSI